MRKFVMIKEVVCDTILNNMVLWRAINKYDLFRVYETEFVLNFLNIF